MTEKRFELIWETDEMCNVFDNDVVSTLSVEEVCDLLNEYDRRCNRWVSENNRLKKEIILIEKRADKVYNENEQLKHDASILVQSNKDYRVENEELKQQITNLYNMVKCDVDNEIEVYPKTLVEYLVNILKIMGDVE